MHITLYNCSSDKRRLIKNYEVIMTYNSCHLKDNTSILDPTFLVKDMSGEGIRKDEFNYVFCAELGRRFYFVKDVVKQRGGVIEIICHVDVLTTYASQIYKHNALVVRSEKKFFEKSSNGIFFDPEYPIRSDATVTTIEIGQVANNHAYYLTVNGGVQA